MKKKVKNVAAAKSVRSSKKPVPIVTIDSDMLITKKDGTEYRVTAVRHDHFNTISLAGAIRQSWAVAYLKYFTHNGLKLEYPPQKLSAVPNNLARKKVPVIDDKVKMFIGLVVSYHDSEFQFEVMDIQEKGFDVRRLSPVDKVKYPTVRHNWDKLDGFRAVPNGWQLSKPDELPRHSKWVLMSKLYREPDWRFMHDVSIDERRWELDRETASLFDTEAEALEELQRFVKYGNMQAIEYARICQYIDINSIIIECMEKEHAPQTIGVDVPPMQDWWVVRYKLRSDNVLYARDLKGLVTDVYANAQLFSSYESALEYVIGCKDAMRESFHIERLEVFKKDKVHE